MRPVLFICSALLLAASLSAETLKEVLDRNKVPLAAFSQTDLQLQVSSGAVEHFGGVMLVVFPSLAAADESLPGRCT